jgi:hypothetical protein
MKTTSREAIRYVYLCYQLLLMSQKFVSALKTPIGLKQMEILRP